MKIAIIGAGKVGTALGSGWTRAGHAVTYGVRDPAKLAAGLHAASPREAVAGAELVVLATPWPAVEGVLEELGDLGGRILVDATNPIGPGFALTLGHTTSGAEHVAARVRNARVVKAFNTTGFENMLEPRFGTQRTIRTMMPIAGDDADAVARTAVLASDLGFEPIAFSSLARSRELEPLAMLWIKLAMQWGQGRGFGFAITRHPNNATPSPTTTRRSIAIVGTGSIGGSLARAWLRAGHAVTLAVRDASSPEVAALVAQGARAVPLAGAAMGAEVIVLALPAGVAVEAARALGDLTGKIVVDCTNAIGKGFTLLHGHTTSWSEQLALALPGARLVRSFSQQGAETLQHPVFDGLPAVNFVAGDDPAARAIVAELARDVGLEAVEAGPLASSRYLEPITLLWVGMTKLLGTRDFALSLVRR